MHRTRVDDILPVAAQAVADAPPGSWVDLAGYDQRTVDCPWAPRNWTP
ncbi:hypothetical protein [Streptomyces sp. NPDC096193]